LPTPAAPSYPSSCSAISAAAAAILAREFGDRFDFSVAAVPAPGLPRPFSSFSAAAQEAGLSRIYAGQHFRFDHEAGRHLGRTLAEYVGRLCYYAA
jgi:membrane-associated phospholipid phosphatase